MPRKTRSPPSPPARTPGFNEAAARCRGKPGAVAGSGCGRTARFNEAAARCRGKPRPAPRRSDSDSRFNEAAARCRGKPERHAAHLHVDVASMRPRPDAAENAIRRSDSPSTRSRFNEAAARCRGKHERPSGTASATSGFNEAAARCRGKRAPRRADHHPHHHASMRPRPDAAENGDRHVGRPALRSASMRPRPDAAENGSGKVPRR